MKRKILPIAILAGTVTLAPSVASAKMVEYFGQDEGLGETSRLTATPKSDAARADFLENDGATFVESFERFEDGSFPYRTPDGRWDPGVQLRFGDGPGGSEGGPTATMITTRGTVVDQPTGTNGHGRYPTDGDKFFHSGAGEIRLQFDRALHGFGFDGIDIGDFRGELSVELRNAQKLVHAFTLDEVVGGEGGDVLFAGVFDRENPFDTVVFNNSNPLTGDGGDVFAMDGMTVVTPVPAALPLLGSGLAALAWFRRRSRG